MEARLTAALLQRSIRGGDCIKICMGDQCRLGHRAAPVKVPTD